jgi:hypothetical protein
MGLSFIIADAPRQRSHSQVRVLRESRPHFPVSGSRFFQPGGSGPRIYIPQEQGDPLIPPHTDFPFRRLQRLAGLRWRYSTLPPHTGKDHKENVFYIIACSLVADETKCPKSCSLATAVYTVVTGRWYACQNIKIDLREILWGYGLDSFVSRPRPVGVL